MAVYACNPALMVGEDGGVRQVDPEKSVATKSRQNCEAFCSVRDPV